MVGLTSRQESHPCRRRLERAWYPRAPRMRVVPRWAAGVVERQDHLLDLGVILRRVPEQAQHHREFRSFRRGVEEVQCHQVVHRRRRPVAVVVVGAEEAGAEGAPASQYHLEVAGVVEGGVPVDLGPRAPTTAVV